MNKIIIPQLNANDESCTLNEWIIDSGEKVKKGDVIAILESSKAAYDFESEAEGILYHLINEGEEAAFGSCIGYIFENEEEKDGFLTTQRKQQEEKSSFKITKLADVLMKQHNITEEHLKSLNKTVIKKSDIETIINKKSEGGKSTYKLSPLQSHIAKVVTLSHNTIPKAFALVKVYSDTLFYSLQKLNSNTEEEDNEILGITEVLVFIVAKLHDQFPLFFSTLTSENSYLTAEFPHIGITIDLGKGLFIPVIKKANRLTLQEIADILMNYRINAMRNSFASDELEGGNISISLNTDDDVIMVSPIILPSQVCMISVSAVQEEVALDAEENIKKVSYFNLGLAYDHRIINGNAAIGFLKTIKEMIETFDDK